jgi:hypothetical protein
MATIVDMIDYIIALKTELLNRERTISELQKEINKTTK